MSEDVVKSNTDAEELDRMEFDIFKKYWQPMMQELIELQELRDSVPKEDISAVQKMSNELDSLRKGFEELKNVISSMSRIQQPQSQTQYTYPINTGQYNPGLAHMPLYRSGQSYVVSPVPQANQ